MSYSLILYADDQPAVDAARQIINQAGGENAQLVGAVTADMAVMLLRSIIPNVIVCSAELPGVVDVLSEGKQRCPNVKRVLIAEGLIVPGSKALADNIVLKGSQAWQRLLESIAGGVKCP